MSNKRRHGDGDDNKAIEPTDFTNTTAISSGGDDCRDIDSVGLQLVVDFRTQVFATTGSDGVVSGTKTWTLSGFTFTGLTGATIVVSGTATSDGTYVISSVTSAHVIVTTTGPAGDETFTAAGRVTVQHTEAAAVPAGDWKIEVSNDFVPTANGTVYGQPSNAGTWTDITNEFSPSLSAVTTAGTQYAQSDITARAMRYTFTPSGGQGTVSVLRFAKSWS